MTSLSTMKIQISYIAAIYCNKHCMKMLKVHADTFSIKFRSIFIQCILLFNKTIIHTQLLDSIPIKAIHKMLMTFKNNVLFNEIFFFVRPNNEM